MAKKEHIVNEYQKVTTGFVTQIFKKRDKKYVCTEQSFIAGDEVSRENEFGEPLDVPQVETAEVYFPFEMKQPSDADKLDLALRIMTERQVEQFQKGEALLEKGVSVDDMPEDIFVD